MSLIIHIFKYIYIFLINLRFPINQTLILITSASLMAWTLLRDLVNVEMRQLICVVSHLNLKYERHTNWIWDLNDDWAHHVLWYCFNQIIRTDIWKYILKMDYAYLYIYIYVYLICVNKMITSYTFYRK